MIEVALQIMLVLAYLAIGLIAVTFPVFAVCVIYLKQEKWETEKERKKQIGSVQTEISELNTKLKVEQDPRKLEQINKRIKKFEKDRNHLEESLISITSRGAVATPIVLLVLSLLFATSGIYYSESEVLPNVWTLGFFSALFIGFALVSLYRTIERIEEAALRSARTIDVDICYKSYEKTCEIRLGVEETLSIGVKPEVDLEYYSFLLYLPPEIRYIRSNYEIVSTLQPTGSGKAGYTMLEYGKPFLRHGIYSGISFIVEVEKEGEYAIPVLVQAKDVRDHHSELTLRVRRQ